MEYVTVLAGEPWSDEPACVDGALAALARTVNDTVSDEARQTLAVHAPDFIGTALVNDRTRHAAAEAVLTTALRRASTADQRFLMCVAILGLRQAAGQDPEQPLEAPDDVATRAREFTERFPMARDRYAGLGLPSALVSAVRVVHDAERGSADDALVNLLTDTLRRYRVGVPAAGRVAALVA
jgi:hypothetical protein